MKIIKIAYIIYKLYKFNEKISGTPKKTEKEMGSLFKIERFIKRSFFKMRLLNFTKKMKKSISLRDDLNTKKISQKLLP
jgi:hypothetical protein